MSSAVEEQPHSWARALLALALLLVTLVSAAHFLRARETGLVGVCLLAPLLLLTRRAWAVRALELLLLAAAGAWVWTTIQLIHLRVHHGLPWLRLALILGAVALITALASRIPRRLRPLPAAAVTPAWAFALAGLLLGVVQVKLQARPMLLLERFVPTLGWLEIFALALYAGWIAEKLLDVEQSGRWRRRIWTLFSVVFFAQLALGLLGVERCLMTPHKMHFPIPALIVAGPLFRGEHFFMLILFAATVALVGPAWCSHLCYLGAWDQHAADGRRRPRGLSPRRRHPLRLSLLLLVVAAAITLRLAGASAALAGGLALGFGLLGVGVMLLASRRRGLLVHCTLFCPVGLLATALGRINPFRVVIAEGCDRCMRCKLACRYDALDAEAIERGRPRATLCTLCGDCLASCRERFLEYRLFGGSWGRPDVVRGAFIALTVALHAATLGLARI